MSKNGSSQSTPQQTAPVQQIHRDRSTGISDMNGVPSNQPPTGQQSKTILPSNQNNENSGNDNGKSPGPETGNGQHRARKSSRGL
jgi:hypothetical protein